ncbi:MAG TPA: O-methyltransferase [Thermoplasmata archaeon]|nr:O-methyltransferase [Thermoplasmata archaeon]
MAQRPSPEDDLELWTSVDRYFEEVLRVSDPELEATLAASASAGLPAIQVSPLQGRLLHLLARLGNARRILEIGTLGGYSTSWLARALPPGGRLLSLELDPRHAEVARSNLARSGLLDRVEIRVGPAAASLEALARERVEPFDLIFLDADKVGYPDYFDGALRLARSGTLLVADNVVRRGDVARAASEDPNVRGVREMAERAGRSQRVLATAVQTVGVKGYDGMLLALVR